MPGRRMRDQTRRFIDDQHVCIFIDNLQRNRFGNQDGVRARRGHLLKPGDDDLAALKPSVSFGGFSLDGHGPVTDGALNGATRDGLRQMLCEVSVKTRTGFVRSDDELVGSCHALR